MKRLLSLAVLALTTTLSAQPDVSITLTSPVANSTIGPGQQFNFDVTITNVGSQDITTSDTVVYLPTVNGGPLTSNGSLVGWFFTGTTIAANGGTETRSQGFGGLSIQGASAGNIQFCGVVQVSGPNWTMDADTSNNTSCNTIIYDPTTVGLEENVVYAKEASKPVDNSYYSNGVYHVAIKNVSSRANEITVIDITGNVVYNTALEARANELSKEVKLEGLSTGIYIVNIKSEGSSISTRKVVVQ